MGEKIAVVNDELDFVEMVTMLLEEEGYEVRSCTQGQAAYPLIKDWHPALVLLDIRMEGLSGWEILHQIEEDPATRSTRVLITSGAVEEAAAARADLHRRGHDFVALPFDLDRFLRKIKQMLGQL